MMEGFTPDDALLFLGIATRRENEDGSTSILVPSDAWDRLEALIVEHDIDVEIDDQDRIAVIDGADLREVLFEEHRKKIGHRPDDPDAQRAARAARTVADLEARESRQERRRAILARHARRAAAEG